MSQHIQDERPLLSTPINSLPLESTRVCRICLEKDDKSNFISPCKCKGSIKYVHAHCIGSWRRSLAQNGRLKELYHCTLCQQRFQVRHRRRWMALLNYKASRILATAVILILVLIPAGTLMKTLIHLSVQLSNYPGGIHEVWSTGSLMKIIIASAENSLRRTFLIFTDLQPDETFSSFATQRKVLYTPFPVCFRSSTSNDHSLVTNTLLYYFLFPLADDRLWHFILCRLEHLHLGFFLLGSINNIWFTYKILNDMFDIVLAVQQQDQVAVAGDGGAMAGEGGGGDGGGGAIQQPPVMGDDDGNDGNQEHDIMQAAVAVAAAAQNDQRIDSITRRLGKLVKGFLLMYCCSLVVLFWIHFNLFAFHIDVRDQDGEEKGLEQAYSSRQFVAEFPLWTFRWITLGIAVGDFATRGIYGWLARITNCVEDEEVISRTIM
ncbi:hypothetical protein BDB00DRAFT_929919 [Zychaea mexicana]|uniref:uncharacterized protein n=1 Tax=Zychaea mexicana TaxID=64656 RepID=UPI0022FE5E98|nr:uncharacterized protein BDB00DRAFT_929919 [Zychaea mexicana]KAI9492211.1 hypothetical protein BDB00DRAFT_929919 [Zychaea mexicana]